jgi:hypothetical protein
MSEPGLRAKLAAVRATPPLHDRWRVLATYGSSSAARVQATRLRRKYPAPAWRFRTRMDPDATGRYRLVVFYAQLPKDGQVQ